MARLPLWPAAGGCLALAVVSLLAPWTPTYDPWAWLVWGRELSGLGLDTTAGPAWKPLPVMVTTLLAPLGEAAPAAWLVGARAAGLFAVVLAARLAARLVRGRGAALAGAVAAIAVLGAAGYARGVGFGNSEGILAALGLLAADRHLDGHRRQAFALGVMAGLVRPEAWVFLLAYGAHLWGREPARRPVLALAVACVPLLWLAPEWWGSGELLRSAQRAQVPNPGAPALAAHPALEVVERFALVLFPPAALAAVGGTLAAVRRGHRRVVMAGAAAVGWVAIVAAMSEIGFSGEERYLLPAAVLAALPAGAGAAWAHRWLADRSPPLGAAAAAAALAGSVAALAPVGSDLQRRLWWDARLREDLGPAIEAAGGAPELRDCGPLYAGRYRFPLVAWHVGAPIAALDLAPQAPGVILRSRLLPGARPEPPVPAGFRRIAASPSWEIFAAC